MKKVSLEEMKSYSLGIYHEMKDVMQEAQYLDDNGKLGDERVILFDVDGTKVLCTNGDPVWENDEGFWDYVQETFPDYY